MTKINAPAAQRRQVLRSLRWAVIGALLVGLGVPATVNLLHDREKIEAETESELRRDLARSAEVLAITLADPLWQVAPNAAEPLVKALIDDARYVSVVVSGQGMAQPFLEIHRMAGAIGETRVAIRPIQRNGEAIGSVSLTMTKAPYLARLDADIRQAIWRTISTLLVSLLLILWVMQYRVLRPMGRLSRAAESLAAGKLDQQLALAGEDEIGRVGAAMEKMRESLLAAFASLRQHACTLEETVDARTSELLNSNVELTHTLEHLQTAQRHLIESEKLASLGRLVAGVAHELNTPLGNAMTVVSTLDERYASLSQKITNGEGLRKSELLELLDCTQQGHSLLQRNVQKAAELVRDFKQVAVDQSSEMRRLFDLAAVIEEVLITIRPRFKHSCFAIKTELTPGITMDSFPGPLGQVLTNLVLNALIHAFEDQETGTVTVSCRLRPDGAAELSCDDDGTGMEDAVQKRIFDPFFTTKMGRGGSGLGLNIAHNICTGVLGGRIEVNSIVGMGTRFEIVLPTKAPSQAQQ